jgi:hypothetical protein
MFIGSYGILLRAQEAFSSGERHCGALSSSGQRRTTGGTMSEEAANENEARAEADTPLKTEATLVYPPVDFVLQQLVTNTNTLGHSYSVTLQVGGLLVTDLMISGAEYFKAMAEIFEAHMADPDGAKVFADSWREVGSTIYGNPEYSSEPPSYIHLKNARYVAPGGKVAPSEEGVLWRGRLSEVQGFNIGSLNVRV